MWDGPGWIQWPKAARKKLSKDKTNPDDVPESKIWVQIYNKKGCKMGYNLMFSVGCKRIPRTPRSSRTERSQGESCSWSHKSPVGRHFSHSLSGIKNVDLFLNLNREMPAFSGQEASLEQLGRRYELVASSCTAQILTINILYYISIKNCFWLQRTESTSNIASHFVI